jgi:hypothetical protein
MEVDDDNSKMDLIPELVTKIDASKHLRTKDGCQAFVKTLRILSQGTDRYLHLAYNALQTTKEEVDKLWNKTTLNDSNLYHYELSRLKDMVKSSISKESYKKLCIEFGIFTNQDVSDFLQIGTEGLVEIFMRAINNDNLVTTLEADNSIFVTYTWHPNMLQWYPKRFSNQVKFISDTMQSDMWYCEFELNHKLSNQETKHRFNQRTLIADSAKLGKKLMSLISERMQANNNHFPLTLPGLFPIANGKVINMKTLEIRDRVKEDYIVGTSNPLIYYEPNVEVCRFANEYFFDLFHCDYEAMDYLIQRLAMSLAGIHSDTQNIFILSDTTEGADTGRLLSILKGISNSGKSPACLANNWFLPSNLTKPGGDINTAILLPSRICCVDGFSGEHLHSDKVKAMSQASSSQLTWFLTGGENSPTAPYNDKEALKSIQNILCCPQNIRSDRILVDPTNNDHLSCVFSVLCRSLQKPYLSSLPAKLMHFDLGRKQGFDFLGTFIEQRCIQRDQARVEHVAFHIKYQQWFNDRYPNTALPNPHQIKEDMLFKNFKSQGRSYLGIDVK